MGVLVVVTCPCESQVKNLTRCRNFNYLTRLLAHINDSCSVAINNATVLVDSVRKTGCFCHEFDIESKMAVAHRGFPAIRVSCYRQRTNDGRKLR